MHPLLRLVLSIAPREFRGRFGDEIAADHGRASGTKLFAAAWSVFCAGCTLRVEDAARDVLVGVRGLSRSRGYAFVSVLAFALAIGANVAVASVLEAVVLRPLPFPHADRLVMVSQGTMLQTQISYLNARDVERRSAAVSGIGLIRETSGTVTGHGPPSLLSGWIVDGSYFSVLGIRAQLGRLLNRRDLSTSNIVITDRTWARYFDRDRAVLGRLARIDGKDYTIVGVAPPSLRNPVPSGLEERDYWSAVDRHSILAGSRVWAGFHGIARLAPGASVASARADVARVLDENGRRYPTDFMNAKGATVVPVLEGIIGDTTTLLWMLYAAVAMVLLIACVNVANLTMARVDARSGELAIRSALGASRSRLASQLMTELLLLSSAGGLAGVALAFVVLTALRSFFSPLLPRWDGIGLSLEIAAYSAALVILTAAFTSLLPVVAYSRDFTNALKTAGRGADRAAGKRVRRGLVVAEVALAIAVVVSAGLVLRSFVALTRVDIGFDPRGLSLLTVSLPDSPRYGVEGTNAFNRQAVRALRSLPGVVDAASALLVPFGFNAYPRAFTIVGRPDPHATVSVNGVSPQFFETMRIPLRLGRYFNDREPTVAIVNAAFARRYFGSADVLGRRVALTPFTNTKPTPLRIVGIVADTRNSYSDAPLPELYVPTATLPLAVFYVVRTQSSHEPIVRAVGAAFARLDPAIAPPRVQSFDDLLASDASRSQAATLLFGILAILALILALSGVYAVTAYGVQQRAREFGIRQAVGASGRAIVGEVLHAAMIQAAIGIGCGVVLSSVFNRFLVELLFEVSPFDPATLAVVVLATACSVFLAALIPACRAARIAPASAIRSQ